MKISGIVFLLLALSGNLVHAEITDTIIAIDEVETRAVRFGRYTPGSRVIVIDSSILQAYSFASLADLLTVHSPASVNSYGPEGVAGVSMRGGSSRHTAVIWNGFNTGSVSSGGFNFSTLPAGFTDQLSIQSGGSSTMYGSGASTGTVILSSNTFFGEPRGFGNLSIDGGSYGTIHLFGGAGFSSQRFYSRLKIGYQESENNFRFKNTSRFGAPVEKLEHAAYSRISASQQNAVRLGKSGRLETDFIYTALDKEIPSLMSDTRPGTAEQSDENLRAAVNFSRIKQNLSLLVRSGLISNKTDYFNPQTMNQHNKNESYSLITEAESKYKLGNMHNLNAGINLTTEHAAAASYTSDTSRKRFSIYGRYLVTPIANKLTLSAEARQEFTSTNPVPFVYSFGGVLNLVQGLSLKSSLAKHYSLPVFDDLFWAEDSWSKGNPDLKPEYGVNLDAGINYLLNKASYSIQHELTFYRNRIDDLIVWLPDSTSKYTPTNVKHSVCRGIEFSGELKKNWKVSFIQFNYYYTYTLATLFNDDTDTKGFQRFYIPKHKAGASLTIKYKGIGLLYDQYFCSQRYIDEMNTLPAYTLANLQLNFMLKTRKPAASAFLKVKNLYNTSYQVMNGYAQPLRNYSLGVNLTI